jgi:hypothetical protein
LALGTKIQNSELGVQGLALGTWHLGQKFEITMPNSEPGIPGARAESRNLELRTWDLIFETGQRYLSHHPNSGYLDT